MLDEQDNTRKVAIACQGGGSHTAFTAGVLKSLLAVHVRGRGRVRALARALGPFTVPRLPSQGFRPRSR